MTAMPLRHVPCPSCRQSALFGPANPWRPFCSQRCRGADLGAWASERFRVPAQPSSEQADGLAGDAPTVDEPPRKGH